MLRVEEVLASSGNFDAIHEKSRRSTQMNADQN